MTTGTLRLGDHLKAHARADVAEVVAALATCAIGLSSRIARNDIAEAAAPTAAPGRDGDVQKALDLFADQAVAEALRSAPVRWYASEERDGVTELSGDGTLAVAVDPLDGSSNIGVNGPIGTIFSIRPARPDGEASFLRPGREQLAAGYVLYGPQTLLALTVGAGVTLFRLDPETGAFDAVAEAVRAPEETVEFAINASNYRRWPAPIRAYVDDCIAGADGPRGVDFNMRWVAAMVADAHRILTRGGVYLYPGDPRPGYARGRLRMVYECAPVAMLMEQAGGSATDGRDAILDQTADALHARSPIVFGSATEVARVAAYHDLPAIETSPLFGRRGLFNAAGTES